ncbi:MAG: Smr/MutS family protein, partial [Myxococcales bacterium]|nr:Smr/MutS family protein [Myxococcales bacterium]
DEALRRLDTFLGEALRRDRDVVVIHHGHGGGILRAAVREHLERQGFVRALRPGLTAEGGDAVTVAWLDP